MKIYHQSSNIKGGLFLIGVILVASLLMYSQSIVNILRDDNREIVQTYAEIIAATVKDESDANLTFVFEEIISKVQFPVIYADRDHQPIYSKNVPLGLNFDELEFNLQVGTLVFLFFCVFVDFANGTFFLNFNSLKHTIYP